MRKLIGAMFVATAFMAGCSQAPQAQKSATHVVVLEASDIGFGPILMPSGPSSGGTRCPIINPNLPPRCYAPLPTVP